jgi:hypothetical protein
MKKFLLLGLLPILFVCCKGKKKTLSGNEDVSRDDFIDFFQSLKIPFQITDDSLEENENDTDAISYHVFTQFVPDSVLSKYFGKSARPKIFAFGKIKVQKQESYLFVKAIGANKKIGYVLCFDKADKFVVSKPLIISDPHLAISNMAVMDAKYTLTLTRQHKNSEGKLLFRKYAYVYNDEGGFSLILTETNDADKQALPVINPIDTLPHRHKLTGDYAQDKRNYISFRDGKDAAHILFFVHFEKDKGDCKGELKGVAKFVSSNTAVYRSNNDPCAVEFSFSTTGVSMKELEGCGNHRDIKCFFEGFFIRHKESSIKTIKKK